MRMKRAFAIAPVLAALLAFAPALNVYADSGISVTVDPRWGNPTPASWNAYEVVISNSGDTDFDGDVILAPAPAPYQQGGFSPSDQYPHYSKHVTVAHQSSQKVDIMVYDAPYGYSAQVMDSGGRRVAEATLATGQQSTYGYTVGVLSDSRGATTAIQGAFISTTKVTATRFAGATDFPKSALDLTGLNAIVIDGFDTGSLSQAQTRAIRDFVALGGNLLIAGGASWRRTLLPLPPEILPLRPTDTREVSLQALADLGGLKTTTAAAVAAGTVTGHPVLQTQDGVPLVVEGSYGAGRIVVLTYDPLADPIDMDGSLTELGWSQGLVRALSGTVLSQYACKGCAPVPVTKGGAGGGPAVAGSSVGNAQPYADIFSSLLSQTPGATAPPLALIGIILLAYVALTGPIAYLVLRRVKRRELLWATAPAAALVFTIASYGIGIGARGSDFIDNSVEVQRITPDGSVQAATYQGLFAPQRGDHVIGLPVDTIATTAYGSYYGGGGFYSRNTNADLVVVGGRSQIQLHGVAVWEPNNFQTLSLMPGSGGLEAKLSYSQGQVKGTVRNRGATPLRDVRLTAIGFGETRLAAEIQPGQTVSVATGFQVVPTTNAVYYGSTCTNTTTQVGREDCVLTYAAYWGGFLPGVVTLVGLIDSQVAVTVDGARPHRNTIAAFAQPVMLSSSDALVAGYGSARLVSAYHGTASYADAYDIDLPTSPSSSNTYTLRYVNTYANAGAQSGPPTAAPAPGLTAPEVYNWATGTWRKLPTAVSGSALLAPDETASGIARVRMSELSPGQYATFLSVLMGTSG